ncbi:MAG: DUF1508 domain-containing protein [Negativicutes bacterium]|nr:DUF1508 domain-containing protein [Negativicutes bacterium]
MADKDQWGFYEDSHGKWRWRRIVLRSRAVSYSRGYPNKLECIANARRFGFTD